MCATGPDLALQSVCRYSRGELLMRKLVLFVSAVLLVLTGCATVGISRGGAPPVNLVIMTESPMRQGDADLMRRITEDYLRQYVRDGQPLTLTLSLNECRPMYL